MTMLDRVEQADTVQITDLISLQNAERHSAKRPYVYFEEHAHGPIKIGYVGSLKQGLRRRKQYERAGAKLLAVIPARDIEERELHREFASDLCDGREYFAPTERLLCYIEWLLDRRFAAPTYDIAEYLGWSDYSAWKPRAMEQGNAIEQDGQLSFFPHIPVRERIARISNNFSALSLTDDWYTPPKWVGLARAVMGDIDLDPASTKQANDECVRARYWITKEQNGLDRSRRWFGRMWINPPYGSGSSSAKMFIARLYDEVLAGNVQQAVTCLNLNTMCNKWFVSQLAPVAAAHCIPSERIEFIPPMGIERSMGAATNGTVFTYVGPHVTRFIEIYSPHGQVLVPVTCNDRNAAE